MPRGFTGPAWGLFCLTTGAEATLLLIRRGATLQGRLVVDHQFINDASEC